MRFIKPLIIIAISILAISCSSSSDNSSDNVTPPSSLPDYSNTDIYPVSDTVVFNRHYVGDIFTLSDGSAWQIVGSSSSSVTTGVITSNVIIYTATASTPDPEVGGRSDFFLIAEGVNPAFFVIPLLMAPSVNDTVVFNRHYVGDIFKLSDDSAWQIVGSSSSSVTTGVITSNVIIYTATASTPDPEVGGRSDFFLIAEGVNPAFFIHPLLMTPIIADTVVFNRHYVGDIFTLSDGSAWQIVGSSSSSVTTGVITSNVIIYTATASTPDPEVGSRSDSYLIGDGINPAFFIIPI